MLSCAPFLLSRRQKEASKIDDAIPKRAECSKGSAALGQSCDSLRANDVAPPPFAAAWVTSELARRRGAAPEDLIAAALTEGGALAGADAAALRAAARDAWEAARGDAASALAILASASGGGGRAPATGTSASKGGIRSKLLGRGATKAAAAAATAAPFSPHDSWLLGPAKPACHERRIAAADAVNRMRATRNGEIESMLRLVCAVFDSDSATCALLTGHCIYLVGGCGALYPTICPDRWGFCGHSFLNPVHELLVIEDLDADARFAANYFVVDPEFNLKFYVAAPMISTDGHRLGTLCVMGHRPQRFDATRAQVLANLAEMMVRQLESQWARQLAEKSDVGAAVARLRPLEAYETPYLVIDAASTPWRVLHMNVPAIDALGVEWTASYDDLASERAGRPHRPRFVGLPLPELFDASSSTAEWQPGGWEFELKGVAGAAGCAPLVGRRFSLHFRLCTSEGLDAAQPPIGIPSFVALSPRDGFGRSLFFVRVEEDPTSAVAALLRGSPLDAAAGDQRRDGANGAAAAGAGGDAARAVTAAALGVAARGDSAAWLPTVPEGSKGAAAGAASVAPSPSPQQQQLPQRLQGSEVGGCWAPASTSSSSCGGCANSGLGSPGASSSGSLPPVPVTPVVTGTVTGVTGDAIAGLEGTSPPPSSNGSAWSVACSTITPSYGPRSGSSGAGVPRGLSQRAAGCGGAGATPIAGLLLGPLVGRGSYGRVYRGLLGGQPVAVKIIDSAGVVLRDSSGLPLEYALTRRLGHPNLMRTVACAFGDTARGVGGGGGGGGAGGGKGGKGACSAAANGCGAAVWMVFEYADRGTVADAVVKGWFRTSRDPTDGATDLRLVATTALEIAAATAHLHANGIVHGDLCGGNVCLQTPAIGGPGFVAKVGDYGLARRLAVNAGQTGSPGGGVALRVGPDSYGTVTHVAPEVLLEGKVSPASDVYSFGVLLWEMLTGSRAWAGLSHAAVILQSSVLGRALEPPAGLPAPLAALLRACLAREPSARPPAAAAARALGEWLQTTRGEDFGGTLVGRRRPADDEAEGSAAAADAAC